MKRRSLWVSITMGIAMVLYAFMPCAEAGSKYTMKYYCIAPPFSPINVGMEKMKAHLDKAGGGEINMELYPSGQLGPESAGLNNLKMGAVQAAAITGVAISVLEPKANMLMLPYVFKTWEDVESFSKGAVMAEIGQSLEKKGLKLMGVGGYGFFNILSTKKMLTDVDDYKGVKIRVYPTPILVDLYKTLGASPTPIAFPEIYTGLQQGVIEATDGTPDSAYASKQYEVAKFLTKTEHLYGWFLLLVNKRWYDKLDATNQALLADAFQTYAAVAREETKKMDAKLVATFAENGVEISKLPPDKRDIIMKATYPIHEKYKDSIGAELLGRFYKELNYNKPEI